MVILLTQWTVYHRKGKRRSWERRLTGGGYLCTDTHLLVTCSYSYSFPSVGSCFPWRHQRWRHQSAEFKVQVDAKTTPILRPLLANFLFTHSIIRAADPRARFPSELTFPPTPFPTLRTSGRRADQKMSLTATPEYRALEAHIKKLKETDMRTLFEEDPNRFSKFR